jgi:two-component system, cell cycle sensor histidine kinase and response regulator CckA
MEERLQAEQVKQFARLAPWAMAATLINATIVAIVLRHQVHGAFLLLWLAAAYLITALRLPLFYLSGSATPETHQIRRLSRWQVAAAAAGGLLWGAAGFYFFPLLTSEYQVFLAFILGGMVAGAAGTHSVLMHAFLAFSLPALLPIMIRFFLLQGEMETAMGFLVLIYLTLMIPISRHIHFTMLNNFRLRFHNEDLVAFQAAARKKAERINLELQKEIAERRLIEKALEQSRRDLEARVAARTRELAEINQQMQLDIAKRRQVEQELRETNELLERIFSTSFLKIAYMDRNFNFIRVNKAYAEADGKKQEFFIGRNHFALYPNPENEALFRQVLTTGRKISFRAKPFSYQDQPELGTTYWDWELIPLFSDQAEVQGVALFLVDVTERIRAEEHLRQAQKLEAIGTLAGGIAHDFNNILNAILGFTELAQRELPAGSPAGDRLEKVVAASRRAADLVRQILAFSNRNELERQPIRLQPEIEEATRLLEGAMPKNITFRASIDEACRPVLANSSQIHQVIMNLGTNGCHTMREQGGILTISLDEIDLERERSPTPDLHPGRYARIAVADTGPGMNKETIARIFDPYFTTKAMGEGSGMGLAIVHGIVKSHQGSIRVFSTPGKGSRFEVLLPVFHQEPVAGTETGEVDEWRESAGRVLLVDDEEMIVQVGREMLEQIGCQVVTALNGKEALEIFRARPEKFDLVITDQSMSELSGAELTELLLEIRPDLPVILITGFSEKIDEQKAKALGVREFIMKPFSLAGLAAAVNRLLEERSHSASRRRQSSGRSRWHHLNLKK